MAASSSSSSSRQLLRKLVQCRRATYSCVHESTRENGRRALDVDQATFLHFAKSMDDEEHRGVSTPYSTRTTLPESRSRSPSPWAEDPGTVFPLSPREGQNFTFQNRFVGRSSLAWIRSASISGPSPMRRCMLQRVALARYSSITGERLEDELGGLPASLNDVSQPMSQDLSSADGGVISNIESSQAISEVAAVVGDCSYPTAMLQLLIESVHVHSTMPWWAAIAVTTALIRLAAVPVVIYQIKAAARLTLIRPELEKLSAEMRDSGYDPNVAVDARERMKAIFKKHKTTPFSPFVGAVLQAPIFICFFFAIQNMAQRVESFKNGGFLWFTDLTTPDSTYILPLVAALTVLITVELGAAEGMEGNPMAHKMKTFMRIFAVAVFPLTLQFEKALFFYWITSSIWSLCQSAILRSKAVKLAVGIPDLSHLVQEQGLAVKPMETITRSAKRIRSRNHKISKR